MQNIVLLRSNISAISDQEIHIKGARVHNLKNVELKIPRDTMVVITGLSGSGKSSLAFDTLYAEGQRRYVESLSAYARQFLGRIDKPDVDLIHGIPPAVALEQRVNSRNPRSTVGTSTEIYDYIKLLFARTGRTYSPVSGKLVKRHSVSDVVDDNREADGDELYLTVEQAAALLRISRSHLYSLRRRGLIETVKLGRFTTVPWREITRLIDEATPKGR